MKSLMPIAADYSGTDLARVAVARRLETGDEPRARRHGKEQTGDPYDDRHKREPPRAEQVADYAESYPHGPRGYARVPAKKHRDDAAYTEQYPRQGRESTSEQSCTLPNFLRAPR